MTEARKQDIADRTHIHTQPDPGVFRSPSAAELRVEVDRLRDQVQELRTRLAPLEIMTTPASAASGVLRRGRKWFARIQAWTKALAGNRKTESDNAEESPLRPYRLEVPPPTRKGLPRIVHFVGNFSIGGSAQLVVDLVEGLGHLYEHVVVSKRFPSHPAYVGLRLLDGSALVDEKSVLALLRRLDPSLVHVHLFFNTSSEESWRWYERIFSAVESYGARGIQNINIHVSPHVSPAMLRYVYVSHYLRETFGRLDGPNQVIYPGSDLAFFERPASPERGSDCVGMVYRLDPGKLTESAILPFIEVIRRRPGTRALIVGDGTFLVRYQKAVREAGLEEWFTFTGNVPYDELPGYIARMSVVIAPVVAESFGQVTPFAMGMRLPIVAYDTDALLEILGSDEFLVPRGDHFGLAQLAIKLLDDPSRRAAIGNRNRERAERLFSLDTMLRSYEDLYGSLLTGS